MKARFAGFQPVRRDRLVQENRHDAYKAKHKLPEPTVCPQCGAVFHEGRWQWLAKPVQAHEEMCPACHRIHDDFPAGFVSVGGAFFKDHREELCILGVCIGFFGLVIILLAVSDYGRQLAQGQLQDPGILSVLGGLGFSEALKAIISARLRDPWTLLLVTALLGMALANLFTALKPANSTQPVDTPRPATLPGSLFSFLLIFTGLLLTLGVEFVYLRDSFGVRMNTVFKFYYQAWVMLACAGAYGFWWLVTYLRKPLCRWAFIAGALLLITLGMLYPLMASWGRVPASCAAVRPPGGLV